MSKLKLDKIKIGNLSTFQTVNKGENKAANTLFAVCSQICESVRCSFEC